MTGAGCEPSPHLYCGGCEKPRPGLEPGYVICNHFKEKSDRSSLTHLVSSFMFVSIFLEKTSFTLHKQKKKNLMLKGKKRLPSFPHLPPGRDF